VTALLTDDTVINNGMGAIDPTQDAMDGSGFDLATQSVVTSKSGTLGLPNDGTFPADANHPQLHLGWNNANDGPNSRILLPGDTVWFEVPKETYAGLQIYALSTEGGALAQITLTYGDQSTDVRNINFGDWASASAPPSVFVLASGLNRIGNAKVIDPTVVYMAGANLSPDPSKKVMMVGVSNTPGNTGRIVFYGAAGW
jgi:hypothetical protein